jgi:light-regulated signal transduction histidine kinase (bacteriophytochrome)
VIEKPESSLQLNARVRRKDGEWCWVESTASNLLHEPDVNAIVLNAREIGARRAAEEEKRRYSEELARSNAELQTFAQNVAHDLREPMRTISAFTQLLIRRLQLSPDNRQFADCIVDGVGRMTKLLEDLLASASYGSRGNFEHLEMELAARQAVQNLSEAISTTGALITLEPLPAVLANESDLIRLFQNLISNAVKYHSTAPVEIRISAEELGPDWVIKIRDNGIGILREHHHRVFGLFTRLDNHQVPGAGIGLAVCKKIVEERGGTIWVESKPGAGSTFCFSWHSD